MKVFDVKTISCLFILVILFVFSADPLAWADSFDPYLHQKAQEYTDWVIQWHSTGLGGVSDIYFTDDTRTEMLRTGGSGDSTDWTAMYLVTQSIRYIVTGDQQAKDEILRIAAYLHIVKDITGDPGYIARYAAPDEPPWNVEYPGSDRIYPGEGEYEGNFWIGKTSRDKYISWFWGLAWAYDAVDDPDMRATIKQDFDDVIQTLISNNWKIVDPWGATWPAANIADDLKMSLLIQAAHVIDTPEYWQLVDQAYEQGKYVIWISTFGFFNKYMDYFAFNNNYSYMQGLFRLWPDRERYEHLWKVWTTNVWQYSKNTHNIMFDAIYTGSCLRIGTCDQDELDAIAADVRIGLYDMDDPPKYQRYTTCPALPLDPFSVWADQFLAAHPWLENLIDIDPQTAEAHRIEDRCWVSTLWERSPYHVECDTTDDPFHTSHGMDYLIGYWLSVWYGLIPGGGPYGDGSLPDDDDDDDNDDDNDTDDDDNHDDDNDTVNDDDSEEDDLPSEASAKEDDDDDRGCGC